MSIKLSAINKKYFTLNIEKKKNEKSFITNKTILCHPIKNTNRFYIFDVFKSCYLMIKHLIHQLIFLEPGTVPDFGNVTMKKQVQKCVFVYNFLVESLYSTGGK